MCPPFLVRIKRVPRPKLSSLTLLQHPPMHSCACCYAVRRPVAAFRRGNHLESLEEKQDRPKQTDSCCCWRRLLGCMPPKPLICFFDGTVALRYVIVINCLPYHLIQTEA